MRQAVDLEVFYPYSSERVWQVLTDRRALAAWMMENDFEPKLGHRFRFYSQPLPGITTTIQCEVVELEEPSRLAYTWQDSSTAEPSLVLWTLTTVPGGTQLQLKHYQHSYAIAATTSHYSNPLRAKRTSVAEAAPIGSGSLYTHQRAELYCSKILSPARLASASPKSNTRYGTSNSLGIAITSEVSQFALVEWDYFLNQTLPACLAQD
jgi:uncharacterized protein YndB with AHSA1/START domain